jgi:phosphoglucosamine mutase
MAPRFGTDGLRGVANVDLTPELVVALGRAVARQLKGETFLVGRDTRRSGPMLLAALASGLAAEGARVEDVGVLPTPGIAWLAADRHHPAAVISASHNPFQDNGIKLLSPEGSKLPDAIERAIEVELDALLAPGAQPGPSPSGASLGEIVLNADALDSYIEHLVAVAGFAGRSLRVVLDCANGAAAAVAPEVLKRLGMRATVLFAEPDGVNINDGCGSTDPRVLAARVVAEGADLGLCFDGDADRLIAVDDRGGIVDGDRLIALFAGDLAARGELHGSGVVVTVMSNLGLRHALEARGISTMVTAIGDRSVVVGLEESGFVLGGEQSGHIVFRREATTGDGILSGLRLIGLLERAGRPLSELADEVMSSFPQELRTIHIPQPAQVAQLAVLRAEIAQIEAELGDSGRVLVRASGTEAAVRVMVEADRADVAIAAAERLVTIIERGLEGN